MKQAFFAAAMLSALVSATAARATPTEYQFQITSVSFGTEVGTFEFDSATNLESDVSITITGAINAADNGVFTQVGPSTPPATTPVFGDSFTDIIVGTDSLGDETYIGFSAPLTPSAGVITAVGNSAVGKFINSPSGIAGTATSVPEPTSLALLGVSIIGLATKRGRLARDGEVVDRRGISPVLSGQGEAGKQRRHLR